MPASGANANPFRSECVERLRYRLDDAGWRALLDRLAALGWCGALVGPCGSGKTTLLEELRARLESKGQATAHWRITTERDAGFNAEFNRFQAAAPGRVLFLDGAEQLSWWEWRRLRRATAASRGLVITTHRAGRLPLLRECGTTPELLADLVGELLGGAGGTFSSEKSAALWRRHAGNVREALRELYDAWPRGTYCWSGAGAGVAGGVGCGVTPSSPASAQVWRSAAACFIASAICSAVI